ncbi:MAG: HD domain-containing protein [Saccharofermentanales bacterium]|jgi:HD superfamily phosphohydrolase
MSSADVQELDFVKNIFDNVHGFIPLTQVECDIVNHDLFQRLRNIKQLGLLEYVFPGAIHNRFNHSLGVMHIADKMVITLQKKEHLIESSDTRQIIRLAALLHDIGHYPLSHIIEVPVRKGAKARFHQLPPPEGHLEVKILGEETESEDSEQIATLTARSSSHTLNHQLHQSINDSLDYAHHERMASIVINKSEIKDILLDSGEMDQERINDICRIIAGSHSGLEMAIIHSELDADRFDYLLRDSKQTGVIYGLFDLDQIIRHLEYLEPTISDPDEGTSGLCVGYNGQKAVEDYLLARYFLYSTVIYQKTSIGFHHMASMVYEGLLERGLVPSYFDLIEIFDKGDIGHYMNFDDSFFWKTLKAIASDPKKIEEEGKYQCSLTLGTIGEYQYSSDFIIECSKRLLMRRPLKLVREEQAIVQKNFSTPSGLGNLHDKLAIETICREADIPKEWYITSKIEQDITELSPFVPLDDIDSYIRLRSDSIKIKKPDSSTKFLIHDPASIVQFLADKQLNIFAVYTKDIDYKKRICEVISNYQS